jgi:transposase, IS30 family
MGQSYEHLSLEERCTIARLQAEGRSIRQIAAAVDRSPSTIARELNRNGGKKAYKPGYANEQAKARRWTGSKLERQTALRNIVLAGLARGLSPEQIAGRLARENGIPVISHETIYRFIYAQIRRSNDFSWRHYLPRGKAKRGWRGKRGGSPASFIEGRISIAERPPAADHRQNPGHWEADLMMFAKYGQAILTLHERSSRLILAQRPAGKSASLIVAALIDILALLPEPLRQTITFDNGTEFARHCELHPLSFKTFFCDPHAPWQKGGIENAIGRMRKSLPRKTDLTTITTQRFNHLVRTYNNTPRKCLDFLTPAEVFISQMLHFKCESTSRLSPG